MRQGKYSALASYSRIANAETDRLQQVAMLYDGAIKFLRLAAGDIENGDLQAKAEHTSRAFDIINYLQSILDFTRGGSVAPVLDALYGRIAQIILCASQDLDAELMRQAASALAPTRDAWAQLAQDHTAAVTQTSAPGIISPNNQTLRAQV